MNTVYLPSFVKDIKALKGSSAFRLIHALVFQEIPNYKSIEQIRNLKKLKEGENAYRIRVGDYRIGIFIEGDTITFARILHRREIYRYFP